MVHSFFSDARPIREGALYTQPVRKLLFANDEELKTMESNCREKCKFRNMSISTMFTASARQLSGREAIADPGDNPVPPTFLGRWIVDCDAVDAATDKVATIVPDVLFAETGDDKKPGRNSFIDYVRWWMFFRQERRG
jgi:hypothetical protein